MESNRTKIDKANNIPSTMYRMIIDDQIYPNNATDILELYLSLDQSSTVQSFRPTLDDILRKVGPTEFQSID